MAFNVHVAQLPLIPKRHGLKTEGRRGPSKINLDALSFEGFVVFLSLFVAAVGGAIVLIFQGRLFQRLDVDFQVLTLLQIIDRSNLEDDIQVTLVIEPLVGLWQRETQELIRGEVIALNDFAA